MIKAQQDNFPKNFIVWIACILILFSIFFNACQYLNEKAGLENDNFIEEIVEEVIESKTGIEIDLTP